MGMNPQNPQAFGSTASQGASQALQNGQTFGGSATPGFAQNLQSFLQNSQANGMGSPQAGSPLAAFAPGGTQPFTAGGAGAPQPNPYATALLKL